MAGPPVAIGQVADRHQLLGQGDARLLDALQEVGRRSLLLERPAQDPDRLRRGLPASGMRREHDRVFALDGVDRDADRRDVGAGDGNEGRDHPRGLGVFDDPPFRDLLDHAHARLPQGVAEDALHLRAPGGQAAAQAALLDAHVGEARGRLLVAARPPHGPAQAVDRRLVVVLDGLHGRPRPLQERRRRVLLRRRDRARGRDCAHGLTPSDGEARRRSGRGCGCASASPGRTLRRPRR